MPPHDFEVIPLPTNVCKCYGCGNDFVDKYRNHPHNIIVKHVDRRVMQKDHLTAGLLFIALILVTFITITLQNILDGETHYLSVYFVYHRACLLYLLQHKNNF